MKRIILLLLVVTAIGCSKDDKDDGTITQKGLLPAPNWLVGTWVSEDDSTNTLTVKENGEMFIGKAKLNSNDNIEKRYYKDDKTFYFFYNRADAMKLRGENDWIFDKKSVIFHKWEFKKLSDTKMSADYYFCDKNGNRLKAGKYEDITITVESTIPTIYTKTK